MKAEHRKQLEQNELAGRLSRWWKGTEGKPSTTLWVVVGVIVLLASIYFFWKYLATGFLRDLYYANFAHDLRKHIENRQKLDSSKERGFPARFDP